MFKKIMIVFFSLLFFSLSYTNIYATEYNENINIEKYITPLEYYKLFIDEFFPNEIPEEEKKNDPNNYESPYIKFLIKKEIIEPIDYCYWEKGFYNLSSFIDKSLLLLGEYDRPSDNIFNSPQATSYLNDINLNLNNYNINEKITKEEAIEIINIFKNTKFNNINNNYFETLKVNYKIDDFINKTNYYNEFASTLEYIPNNVINILNENNYKFILTNDIDKYYPGKRKRKNITGTTIINERKIILKDDIRSSTLHEIGHAIHLSLINDYYLQKLYKKEGNIKYNNYESHEFKYEYFAKEFENIIFNSYIHKNENYIEQYKKEKPITYEIIYNQILNADKINKNEIIKILKKI